MPGILLGFCVCSIISSSSCLPRWRSAALWCLRPAHKANKHSYTTPQERPSGAAGGREAGREGILHLAKTFRAFPSGEREAVPAKACLQTYLKLDLDTAGCWAWQHLCTAGARAERGNTSGPDRCFWSLNSAGFLLSRRF